MAYNGLNEPILLFVTKSGQLVPAAGLQPGYGPHASLSAAHTALTQEFKSVINVPQGYTFCVIENNKPVEYWFYKSGGWYVEKKCNGSNSSSSGLEALYIKLNDDSGFLEYSKDGGISWNSITKINSSSDLTNLKLRIVNGKLEVTYDNNWDHKTIIGNVGGDGSIVGYQTLIRFTSNGDIQVSYNNGDSWETPTGGEYLGNRIGESAFRRLLEKFLKFKLENGYLKVAFDGGNYPNSWTTICKSCTCNESSGPDTQDDLYMLKVYVTPSDASIYIDSALISGNSQFVATGNHTVRVEKAGYTTETRQVTVSGPTTIYVDLVSDSATPMATLTIVPVDTNNVPITDTGLVVKINNVVGNSITVPSGTTCYVEISGTNYQTATAEFLVDTTQEQRVTVTTRAEEDNITYEYRISRLSLQGGLIRNSVGATSKPVLSCYKRTYQNGQYIGVSKLTPRSAYIVDGNGNPITNLGNILNGYRDLQQGDSYYPAASDTAYLFTFVLPPAEKRFLIDGYRCRIMITAADENNNEVNGYIEYDYEGFWEYTVEKHYQYLPFDNDSGGTVKVAVDSFCRADAGCPGDHDTMYACALDNFQAEEGIECVETQVVCIHNSYREYSLYPNYQTDTFDRGNNIRGRTIFTVSIPQLSDLESKIFNTDDNKYYVPFTVDQINQDNNYVAATIVGNEYLVLSGLLKEQEIMVEGGGVFALSSDYTELSAYGDKPAGTIYASNYPHTDCYYTFKINSLLDENSGWIHNGSAGVIINLKYGATVLHSVKIDVDEPQGSSPQLKYNFKEPEVLSYNFDGYITGINIKTGPSSSPYSLERGQIRYNIDYGYSYLQDREYTIEVIQIASGKKLNLRWTLKSPEMGVGSILYNNQFAPNSNGGEIFFGILDDLDNEVYSAESFSFLGTRQNQDEVTIQEVNTSSLPSTLRSTYRWNLQHNAVELPFHIITSGVYKVKWFKVTYPEVLSPDANDNLIRLNAAQDVDFYARQEQP